MQRSFQLANLVKSMIGYERPIHVSEYCYDCFISGKPKKKTLIIIPENLDSKGIVSIDKPLEEVTYVDIIMNFKRLKQCVKHYTS